MPRGDIPGWRQVFADDFSRKVRLGRFPKAVSSRWTAYPDGAHDSSGHGRYYCSRVCSVSGGVFNLHIHTERGIAMVAAPYPRIPRASDQNGQRFGRYAIRFRADAVRGYKAAWLLWPDSGNWPHDGEIDFPEGLLNGHICAFVHHLGATSDNDQDAFCTAARYTRWHTAVIEWSPGRVRFALDGRTVGISRGRVPNRAMHWVLQTETALDGTIPSRRAAGNVQIDWVAVYRRA
jgi:hypothetical protein